MPTIRLTDQLGLELEAQTNPDSSLSRYLGDLARFRFSSLDFTALRDQSLNNLPVRSAQAGLDASFQAAELPVSLSLGAGFEIFGPREADEWHAGGPTYLSLELTLGLDTLPSTRVDRLKFGFKAGAHIQFRNEKPFDGNTPFTQALTDTLKEYTLPVDLDDLQSLTPGTVACVEGSGKLKFSGTANLLAATNPLATVSLPPPAGDLEITAGGSVQVGASFELESEYELRMRKSAPGRIRLAYRRKTGTEFGIKATVAAGVAADIGEFDLISTILGAVSRSADTDVAELRQAGLDSAQVKQIRGAVKAGVQRKLEVSATFALGALRSHESIFEYEIHLDALEEEGRDAVARILNGDLSGLSDPGDKLPAGVQLTETLFTTLRERTHTFTLNLLGIYNSLSISKLALEGSVKFEPETGDLVVSDTATGARISAAAVNFGADAQKLRQVLAESFLITAAYHSSGLAAAPELEISQSYFELHNRTNWQTMKDNLDIAQALGLLSEAEKQGRLDGLNDFGRTTVYADASYDSRLATALFLNQEQPRSREEYEQAGRGALQLLVQEGDPDDYRRRPATDEDLWREMRKTGQAGLGTLFPELDHLQVEVIRADYTVIVWWADVMQKTGESLAALRLFLREYPTADLRGDGFAAVRDPFRKQLESVAANTRKEFGDPWGLVAMDLASGRAATTRVQFTGPRMAFEAGRERRGVTAGSPV